MNPLDWTAEPFLMLFVAVAAVTLLLIWAARTEIRQAGDGQVGIGHVGAGLDVMHLAYLAGGAGRALDTAMVALFEAGAAAYDKKRSRAVIDGTVAVAPALAPYRAATAEVTRTAYHSECRHLVEGLRSDLVRLGFAPTDEEVKRFQTMAWLGLCVPIGLGLAKVVVGLERGRPVGFLMIGLIVTAVVGGLLAARVPSRNRAGSRVLDQLRNGRAARAPLSNELAFAFALGGTVALSGTPYKDFFASGDGGGDGGGSGCGGGGGGGCGGCGS